MRRAIVNRIIRWLVVAAMCALPVQGFAGNGPAKLVVVAKSGGDFTSPIAAMSSITDASANNRYLVKVMPGTYNLGSTSLMMKEYVYLEGSGDSSVITSSVVNPDDECLYGTVTMANNSSVKNIRITSSGPDGDFLIAGVVFNNVKATLESVSVLAGSDTVNTYHPFAVCSFGESANATLNNVNLEAHDSINATPVAIQKHSTMLITNSKITAVGGDSTHVIDCHNSPGSSITDELSMANIIIKNS